MLTYALCADSNTQSSIVQDEARALLPKQSCVYVCADGGDACVSTAAAAAAAAAVGGEVR